MNGCQCRIPTYTGHAGPSASWSARAWASVRSRMGEQPPMRGVLVEGEGSIPVYVQALLEQTAENMANLQRILQRGEDSRGQANQAVLVFPEGERTFTGEMNPLRPGISLLIKRSQVPIIPVGIAGADQRDVSGLQSFLPLRRGEHLVWPARGGSG